MQAGNLSNFGLFCILLLFYVHYYFYFYNEHISQFLQMPLGLITEVSCQLCMVMSLCACWGYILQLFLSGLTKLSFRSGVQRSFSYCKFTEI